MVFVCVCVGVVCVCGVCVVCVVCVCGVCLCVCVSVCGVCVWYVCVCVRENNPSQYRPHGQTVTGPLVCCPGDQPLIGPLHVLEPSIKMTGGSQSPAGHWVGGVWEE